MSSDRIAENIIDAFMRPVYFNLLEVNKTDVPVSINYCSSFENMCSYALEKMNCPLFETVNNDYLLIFPSAAPYTTVTSSNPSLQFIDPMQVKHY